MPAIGANGLAFIPPPAASAPSPKTVQLIGRSSTNQAPAPVPVYHASPAPVPPPSPKIVQLIGRSSTNQAAAPKVTGPAAKAPTSTATGPAAKAAARANASRAMALHFLTQQVRNAFLGERANGLLPPGATMPQVTLDHQVMIPSNGGIPGPYTTTGFSAPMIHFPPDYAAIVAQPHATTDAQANAINQGLNDWAREAVIHETAHAYQNRAALAQYPLAEGGAQAYADMMAPKILSHYQNQGDTNYSGFVQGLRNSAIGQSWIRQGQFNPINYNTPNFQHVGVPAMSPFARLNLLLNGNQSPTNVTWGGGK